MTGEAARVGARSRLAASLSIAIAVSLLVLAVAGCGSDPASLVGTWTSEEGGETLELRADGTAYLRTTSGSVATYRWQADDSNLAVWLFGGGDTRTFGYSVDDGVLKLSYPEEGTVEFVRTDATLD